MTVIPHLALPLRVIDGHLATVEQDSEADILQCVRVVLLTPRGARDELPEFGVPDQAFHQGGADIAEIDAAIAMGATRRRRRRADDTHWMRASPASSSRSQEAPEGRLIHPLPARVGPGRARRRGPRLCSPTRSPLGARRRALETW